MCSLRTGFGFESCSFISVLCRFIARGGGTAHIYSHNAKTFIAVHADLSQILRLEERFQVGWRGKKFTLYSSCSLILVVYANCVKRIKYQLKRFLEELCTCLRKRLS